jgi:hypothetical protein
LGIDEKAAVRIKEIKQLAPTDRQSAVGYFLYQFREEAPARL